MAVHFLFLQFSIYLFLVSYVLANSDDNTKRLDTKTLEFQMVPLCADSRCQCQKSDKAEDNGSAGDDEFVRVGHKDSAHVMSYAITVTCHIQVLDEEFNRLLNNSRSVQALVLVSDTMENHNTSHQSSISRLLLTLPWKVIARKPALQTLDLSSVQLSCDCANSWLAFWTHSLTEPLISIDLLRSLTIRRRRRSSVTTRYSGLKPLHVINEEPSCPYNCSLTVAELFHLPKRILLPVDQSIDFENENGNECWRNKTNAFLYFAQKCRLERLSLDTEKIIANESSEISVTCTRKLIDDEDENISSLSNCPALKLAPFLSTNYGNAQDAVMENNSFRERGKEQRWPLKTRCVNNATTLGEKFRSSRNESSWLLCLESNPFLPQAALAPFIIAGPPQILNFVVDDLLTPEQLHLAFYVVGYPRPQFGWYNHNEDKWPKANATKGFEVILTSKPSFGHYIINGRAIFSELSMNCFKGTYDFVVCNTYGCDKRPFNITQGMPSVMCPPANSLLTADTNTADLRIAGPPWIEENNPTAQNGSNYHLGTTKRYLVFQDASALPNFNKEQDNWVYIAVPFLVVFAVVLVGVLTTFLFLRLIGGNASTTRQSFRKSTSSYKARPSLSDWEMSPLNQQQLPSFEINSFYVDWLHNIKTHVRVFPTGELTIIKELGEGAFGRVFLAKYTDNVTQAGMTFPNIQETTINRQLFTNRCNESRERFYAMKLLKNVTAEKLEDLEREAAIMSQLDHPNIVQFFGLSFKSGKLALLFEYMENGDLVNYLRTHSPDSENCQSPLQWNELTMIAIQIAKGLEYLAEHHLVHRDLAARNCLVGKELVVKISDFGMTRDIYITDYYKMGSRTLVPLRWLPPESILYRKFTVESDMWSFGVLLWEIFSYGKIPWYMHSNSEVLQIIQDGRLLERPDDSPEEIYNYVMLKCWSKHPSERISANTAREKLEELIEARLRYCNVLPTPVETRPNSPEMSTNIA